MSTAGPSAEKVVIDPTKGGAVSPKAAQHSKALEVQPGFWIWDGVVKILEVDIFSPSWEVRHGAAMALRELLKIQGECGGMRGLISGYDQRYIYSSFFQMLLHGTKTKFHTRSGVTTWLLNFFVFLF
jgi:hypothetical protein